VSEGFDQEREAILRTFAAEGAELLAAMERELTALESDAHDGERLRTLFRLAHTVKGNASLVGLDRAVELAHRLESALAELPVPVDAAELSPFFAAVEELRGAMRPGGAGEQDATVRIDLDRLDRMLERIGEVAAARLRGEEIDQPLRELEALVSGARTVPIGPSFRPYARLVRELAEAHGKRARLSVDGEEVEVDARVVQQLREPMTHLIRNAIDHGLEPPEQRIAAGKDEVGTLALSARRSGAHLVVELADDGAGIDRERIRARAIAAGRADASGWDAAQLDALLWEPGFSTAERVTDLSGRGVGLDVVKRQIESMRGNVQLVSTRGRGTRFRLRVPISAALVSCFAVASGGEVFLLPAESVRECVELRGHDGGSQLHNLRGEALAWVRLDELFAMPCEAEAQARESLVVVQHGSRGAGLVVERILGEQLLMVKPLARLFQHAGTVSGSAVLGSGRVALLLDVPQLVDQARRSWGER
jgi:two-component system chemotaxis sensor kinase CheA